MEDFSEKKILEGFFCKKSKKELWKKSLVEIHEKILKILIEFLERFFEGSLKKFQNESVSKFRGGKRKIPCENFWRKHQGISCRNPKIWEQFITESQKEFLKKKIVEGDLEQLLENPLVEFL